VRVDEDRAAGGGDGELSVADVAEARWGVRPESAIERFDLPGWVYEQQVETTCPRCQGVLHSLRKSYESGGRTYRYVAVVCPGCPASFTLTDLGMTTSAELLAHHPARVQASGDDRAAPEVVVGDTSVGGVAYGMWGVRPPLAVARYSQPGWRYLHETEVPCAHCHTLVHALYRIYQQLGQPRVQAALVCPACPATFTTRQLKVSRGLVLGDLRADIVAAQPATNPPQPGSDTPGLSPRPSTPAGRRRGQPRPTAPGTPPRSVPATGTTLSAGPPTSSRPTQPGVQIRPVRASTIPALAAAVTSAAPAPARDRRTGLGPTRAVTVTPPTEQRLLHWCKTTDPEFTLPNLPTGTDIRVLLPAGAAFDGARQRLAAAGAAFRSVAYWVEQEIITTVDPNGGDNREGRVAPLSAATALTALGGIGSEWGVATEDQPAYDARDAFEKIWDTHTEIDPPESPVFLPAADVVPAAWLDYLPFPQLNPAQAQAAPAVLSSPEHLVITAPTGAGKTVIGMLAALRTILAEGRKAAWLVPQRSLTDELDRELEGWRAQGLRVERLSGEYSTDIEKVRAADLWVATTEKFEAICRASSLQAALGEVGCLVVDEIHLLGAAERGPLLEALLARVRGSDSPVRIVGLSATVSNADEIAEWLDGQLISTTWRPSRLTWQLPMIPAVSNRATDTALRAQVTVELTQRVTGEGGSVLVFCGTKPNVRATALALAQARGAHTAGVDPDDTDRVHQVCASVRIGLHYKDWEFKREAEARFRARDWDVLVATTTVAAGVNLPARAVIIRDTRVGLDELDVATVLQMFGRAGRISTGEYEGWAYLVTTELERANWQGALVDGYTVYSQIHASLPDHVLAEVLQGRITTVEHAEQWWLRTLSHHQGDEDTEPVTDAVKFLLDNDYLTNVTRPDGAIGIDVTDLGRLTARLMVNTRTGAHLRSALANYPPPHDPDTAEDALIWAVSMLVPDLAYAPVAEPYRPTVAAILKAGGHRDRIHAATAVTGLGAAVSTTPGDLARAALLLVARSPALFARPARMIAGVPANTLFPVLEQAPRYLAWLAAQGYLGTVHPWIAIVAADLGRRVRWRRCAPPRGAGRLLWMCEHLATPPQAGELVPRLWKSATARGITAPDWPHGTPPRDSPLTAPDYTILLRDRATSTDLAADIHGVAVSNALGATLVRWTGATTARHPVTRDESMAYPTPASGNPGNLATGAAVFTKRGDYKALGWLAEHYHAIAVHSAGNVDS
jgi:helicase